MSEIQLTNKFSKLADDEIPLNAGSFSRFNMKANRKVFNELVLKLAESQKEIAHLTALLNEHSIPIPPRKELSAVGRVSTTRESLSNLVMENTSEEVLTDFLLERKEFITNHPVRIEYMDLTYWTNVPKSKIATVGSTIYDIIFGVGEKRKINIIKGITGRVEPGKMTLVMGPPGCG